MLCSPWKEDEVNYLIEHSGIMSWKNIGQYLGRTHSSVLSKASKLRVKGNPSFSCERLYERNSDFFSVLNPISCYWAGFIAADGCIQRNQLQIKLSVKDKDHLSKFITDICYIGPVYNYNNSSQISISDTKIIEDLKNNFNITSQKSLTLCPPKIKEKEHVFPFIVGYIDGDGCIRTILHRNKISRYLSLDILGTEALLTWIKEFFDYEFPNKKPRSVYTYPKWNYYKYSLNGLRCWNILSFLCSIHLPKLERKWRKVIEYCKENTNE